MKGLTKGKNRKKKIAAVSAALAIFAILAGTFAWTSYTEWVKNHMQSRGYEEGRVTIVEKFKPKPIDDNPEITKEVSVVNTSSTDAFIRISFEEMLHKLANGAAGKGYANTTTAKFPVIINDAEYRSGGYTDATDLLVIKDVKDGTKVTTPLVKTGEKLKLYVSNDGTKAVLLVEKPMKAAEFPKDFDFEANNAKVPVISGSFGNTPENAVVAQKVTGLVEKQADGNYEVYTSQYSGDESLKNLGFWGYGVDKATAATEADWAGVNVHVSASVLHPTEANKSQSAADPKIKFTQANLVTSFTENVKQPGKWYYDAASGYFYYLDVLNAGATTSGTLMEKITFPDASVDQTYKVASYNLWVGLESIPATRSAIEHPSNFGGSGGSSWKNDGDNKFWVSNDSGWGLDPAKASDQDLIAFYKSIASVVE